MRECKCAPDPLAPCSKGTVNRYSAWNANTLWIGKGTIACCRAETTQCWWKTERCCYLFQHFFHCRILDQETFAYIGSSANILAYQEGTVYDAFPSPATRSLTSDKGNYCPDDQTRIVWYFHLLSYTIHSGKHSQMASLRAIMSSGCSY